MKLLKKAMTPSSENETHSKILNAAKLIFSRHGFNGARIDQIAKEANVNKAMIYYHYKSKEDLYDAVVDSIFSKDCLSYLKNSSDEDTFQKLEQYINYFYEKMESNKWERCSIIAREMVSKTETFTKMRDKYWIPDFKLFIEILETGKQKGHFRFNQPAELIAFTIISHIVFYKISEVTYVDSELFDTLYPPNHGERMIQYLRELLKKIIL
jgi:TetR/AcrR family transcriptional regulator